MSVTNSLKSKEPEKIYVYKIILMYKCLLQVMYDNFFHRTCLDIVLTKR